MPQIQHKNNSANFLGLLISDAFCTWKPQGDLNDYDIK